MNKMKKVLPVIHHLDASTTLAQADLAFRENADGVFLISHDGRNEDLFSPARTIKQKYPDKTVGINLLGQDALKSLETVIELGIDALWTDTHGVSSESIPQQAIEISQWIKNNTQAPLIFASVAFKYQAEETDPGEAARRVAELGMIPTTSGPGTGKAPDLSKIVIMNEALSDGELAVASGMTPENVHAFLPYLSHYLVATGVSIDAHHFDEERLGKFISLIKNGTGANK
jgi:predicted TIM-barrel enzyme